jgi:hypothetical protein
LNLFCLFVCVCRIVPAALIGQLRAGDTAHFPAVAAAVITTGPGKFGPRATLTNLRLSVHSERDRRAWLEVARIEALLGSCARTLKSVRSGLRVYIAFVDAIMPGIGCYWPPKLEVLLAWSRLFRCGGFVPVCIRWSLPVFCFCPRSSGTWGNYIGYVKTACMIVNAPVEVMSHPALGRAKATIRKFGGFVSRKRLFLQWRIVIRMVTCGEALGASRPVLMLFLLTYTFLLRLPSEALPAVRGSSGLTDGVQSALALNDKGELELRLRRRKNLPSGSVLRRACWCATCKRTCPVHVLWPFFASHATGASPFAGVTAAGTRAELRRILARLGVVDAPLYGTHDFRRGHAKDLVENGATIAEILSAGQWRSPAFLQYQDIADLERDAVAEAHMDESSDEEVDRHA